MANEAENTADAGLGSAKKAGFMTIVKAIAFVSIIVLLQVAAASMLVPSSEQTVEIANQLAAADAAKEIEGKEDSAGEEPSTESLVSDDMVEVPLGAYHIVTHDQDTGASLNVDFELIGIVLADEESEFFSLFETNANRIREQVYITVRGSEVTDLTEATLGLIKRKILEKTNRALGKPLLREAVFSSFSFVER
ncbi:MAG: hypothetical protein KDA57_14870 [Planctomycetales bacterium]|nr:hypothetical protein [Planctomycetales bacterium]